MSSMQPGLEILGLNDLGADYVLVRAALHGRLAIPFEVPKSTYVENFRTQDDFEAFVARQCQTLLDAYGDAREQRQEPDFVV